MFPKEKPFPNLISHFPARWQAVIFRNYGIIPTQKLAEVLETDLETIHGSAEQLGIGALRQTPERDLRKDAYLTVLRSNWHLLNYPQLLTLMDYDGRKLEACLYEDDFSSVKLGDKPELETVRFAPLTPEQETRTRKLAQAVEKFVFPYREPAFAFRKRFETPPFENPGITVKLIPESETLLGYADFFKRAYDLSAVRNASILCRAEKRADWGREDFVISAKENSCVIDASEEIGILRGLQYYAECSGRVSSEMPGQTGMGFLIGTNSGTSHTFRLEDRIVYSYFATCGDVLLEGGDCCYSDGLLAELAKRKVNGVWLHGLLRQLSPFPWEREYSKDYEVRRKNLNGLIERAKKFGIKIWLYLNEPRSLPLPFFERHPELLGGTEDGFGALCTSKPEVLAWLEEAATSLYAGCPELGGAISITMSENLTNCFSRVHTTPFHCPYCKRRTPQDAASEVNRVLQNGIRKAQTGAKLIVWTWGWGEYLNWDRAAIEEGIAGLDPDSIVMCTSEDSLRVVKGQTVSEIIDYTMSNIGPSEKTATTFAFLKERNKKYYAKVQINNTWECAAVPFIPVFSSVETHIKNLLSAGAGGMLLSWTLGGYPTYNLDLVSKCISRQDFSLEGWFEEQFGGDASAVRASSQQFSRAFAEFPFSLDLLYKGPQNAGCQNLMYAEPTGLSSTMVCYPFDDLKSWCGPFAKSALIRQFERLTDLWRQGVLALKSVSNAAALEVSRISEAVYLHFYSSYLQIRFISLRNAKKQGAKQISEMFGILCLEQENTLRMLELQSEDSAIGYEASNQYFYDQNTLLEKLVNLDDLKRRFTRE